MAIPKLKLPKKPKNFRNASLATLQLYVARCNEAKKKHAAKVQAEKSRMSLVGKISGASFSSLSVTIKKRKKPTTAKKKKATKKRR